MIIRLLKEADDIARQVIPVRIALHVKEAISRRKAGVSLQDHLFDVSTKFEDCLKTKLQIEDNIAIHANERTWKLASVRSTINFALRVLEEVRTTCNEENINASGIPPLITAKTPGLSSVLQALDKLRKSPFAVDEYDIDKRSTSLIEEWGQLLITSKAGTSS